MLDKNPIKVLTEAKFLGVVFDWTLSYNDNVNYLKTNCLKALYILKVVGHTDWGADLSKNYSAFIGPQEDLTGLWLYMGQPRNAFFFLFFFMPPFPPPV